MAKIASSHGATVNFEARPSFSVKESHDTYEKLLHAAMSAQVPEDEFLVSLGEKAEFRQR